MAKLTEAEKPAEAWPLATFLVEEMQARGWTTDDVAKRIAAQGHIAEACLEIGLLVSVVDEHLIISDETIAKLATAFGVSGEYFRNLHNTWMIAKVRHGPEDVPDDLYGPVTRYMIEATARRALTDKE